MKTAARRASRRLMVLPGTLELLHRHVDRLDLDVAHRGRARRRPAPARPPRPRAGRCRTRRRAGAPRERGRPGARRRAAGGPCATGRPRPTRPRRRTISVSAASLTRTEPPLSCTSTRLKSRPAPAASRRPPRGMTSSTRRCGTRRCRGSRAAPRASSGTPTISNSLSARNARPIASAAIAVLHDHLRDQRVVVRRDRRALLDERVDADAGAERRPEALDRPGRRGEVRERDPPR